MLRHLLSTLGGLLRWGFYGFLVFGVCLYGFLLIFAWHAGQRETQSAEDVAPAKGRYVKAADVNIFVQEAGPPDGMDVVLVPGIGGWSGTWPQTMSMLAQAGYHVVALDLPPFGFSQRPEAALYSKQDQADRILGVMDALAIPRAILVAHSTGGGPAVEAATLPSKRVRALVLIGAELDIAFNRKHRTYPPFVIERFLSTPSLRDGVVSAFISNPLFSRHLLKWLSNKPGAATEAWAELYRQPLKLNGTTAAVSAWLPEWLASAKTARSEDPATYLKLNMPIHLIWGDYDTIAPVEQAQELARLASNTTLRIIYGAGHLPHVEETPFFNDMLLKSLNHIKHDLEARAAADKTEKTAAAQSAITKTDAKAESK
ncbi:MAG: alpha/beta hydrolase, partial [Burkholderiales bacterium]